MAEGRPARWTRLAHEDRRAQILTVARRQFRERPYAQVSTAGIAAEAGVARGLLHHYFGSKRELYLEVLRDLLRMPEPAAVADLSATTPAGRVAEMADRWLDMLERNRKTWLAVLGARGFGRDREVEEILDRAREQATDLAIELAGLGPASEAPPDLRAMVRSFGGLAEEATLEWLVRRRLEREQVHVLLVEAFMRVMEEVLPQVRAAGVGAGRPDGGLRDQRSRPDAGSGRAGPEGRPGQGRPDGGLRDQRSRPDAGSGRAGPQGRPGQGRPDGGRRDQRSRPDAGSG